MPVTVFPAVYVTPFPATPVGYVTDVSFTFLPVSFVYLNCGLVPKEPFLESAYAQEVLK